MEPCCSRFTAPEGGARLAVAAGKQNTLAVEYASFVSLRLIYEEAYKIRGPLSDGRQRSVYITRASRIHCVTYEINIMTDLSTLQAVKYTDFCDWHAELENKQVLVCTSEVLKQILEEGILQMIDINVMVIDSCHHISEDFNLKYIMYAYKECDEEKRPRILALTYPLFTLNKKEAEEQRNQDSFKIDRSDDTNEEDSKNETDCNSIIDDDTYSGCKEVEKKVEDEESKMDVKEDMIIARVEEVKEDETETSELRVAIIEERQSKAAKETEVGKYENLDDFDMYEKLEWKIGELEKELCCRMDLAEDIDGGKRVSASMTKPKELVIEYSSESCADSLADEYTYLEKYMRETVQEAMSFLEDHRHDPTEIYGEELYEEFKNIPDPTLDPKSIFRHFIYILDQLGPYAADKAALSLLSTLEKLKIKVPYERHFLLLCLCTTVLVKIRCQADLVMQHYGTEWDKIRMFSTPKVMRFIEILEQFQPPECIQRTENSDITQKEQEERQNRVNAKHKLLKDIEKCNFSALGDKIEDKLNTYAANLKDLDDYTQMKEDTQDAHSTPESLNTQRIDRRQIRARKVAVSDENFASEPSDSGKSTQNPQSTPQKHCLRIDSESECSDVKESTRDEHSTLESQNSQDTDCGQAVSEVCSPDKSKPRNQRDSTQDPQSTPEARYSHAVQHQGQLIGYPKMGTYSRRTGNKTRGRGRLQRNVITRVQQLQQNPDALCGIVYLKEPLMAKILFMMIVELTRCHEKLAYLNAQYCAVENVEEPRECQVQGKKREEVLKKFRMHDCNLLLATPALEEGIDLPRCNMVLRWDVPPSYRSYGQCRGRARANRAMAGLMCSDAPLQLDTVLQNLATYRELDQVVNRKCGCGIQDEPSQAEESYADTYTSVIKPYTPLETVNIRPTTINIDLENKSKINDNYEGSCSNTRTSNDEDKKIEEVPITTFDTINISNDAAKESTIAYTNNTDDVLDNIKSLDINKDCKMCFKSMNTKVDNDLKRLKGVVNNFEELQKNNDMKHDERAQLLDNIRSKIEDEVICNKNDISGSDNSMKYAKITSNDDELDKKRDSNENDSEKSQIDNEIKDNYKRLNDSLYCDKCNSIKTVNIKCPCAVEIGNNECDARVSSKTVGDNHNENRVIDNTFGFGHSKLIIGNHSNLSEDTSHNEVEVCASEIKEINDKDHLSRNGVTSSQSCKYKLGSDDLRGSGLRDCHIKVEDNSLKIKDVSDGDNLSESGIREVNDEGKLIGSEIRESDIGTEDIKHRIMDRTDSIRQAVKGIDDCVQVISDIRRANDLETLISVSGGNSASASRTDGSSDCGIRNIFDRIRHDLKTDDEVASVDLCSAIALINRYCGKLPSDTFTRLVPQWWTEEVQLPTQHGTRTAYICTLRLPLNCPVKNNIVGHPMPTRVLARRLVALQACRILHRAGELDDQLMPIGKENFKADEPDATGCSEADAADSARPGTTKRRQYYYKRTATAFTDCQPVIDTSDSEIDPPGEEAKPYIAEDCTSDSKKGIKRNMLYAIVSRLWCALPERYNTRGRRLHAPQTASQAIGILMARTEPDSLQIPAFPVYTRSGEVRVSVELVPDADVRMSPRRGRLIRRFMRFVFAEVLRVRRRGMKLQSEGSTHNNYYIVPTFKTTREDGSSKIDVDWSFLEVIYQHIQEKKLSEPEKPFLWPQDEEDEEDELQNEVEQNSKEEGGVKKMENPLLNSGETFVFDPEKYKEAVVTPWYRNQDQPQFFLVAEICWNLTPDSAFPSATHDSFREYYLSKYGAALTQPDQPLLDVDHTSARLNLLTPRYVNRKGVALPVSSERTRRAKRDRLDQKQILVPELTRVHPFAAPLWFATVALPCVLYRINALLIADEIRRAVAIDVGLGVPKIDENTVPGFQWPALDFGWSLAEVLSADSARNEKKKEEEDAKKEAKMEEFRESDEFDSPQNETEDALDKYEEVEEKTINDILQEKEDAENQEFEIGTWSNDMASCIPDPSEYDELLEPLPSNLTFCTTASAGGANWCEPVERRKREFQPSKMYSMADSDCSNMSSDFDTDDSDFDSDISDEETDTSGFWSSKNSTSAMGVRIEYKTAHEAEAVDVERVTKVNPAPEPDAADDRLDRLRCDGFMREGEAPAEYIEKFRRSVEQHRRHIERNSLIRTEEPVAELLPESPGQKPVKSSSVNPSIMAELFPYGAESVDVSTGQITLESLERNKRVLLEELKYSIGEEEAKKLKCFSMKEPLDMIVKQTVFWDESNSKPYYKDYGPKSGDSFDFDYQPNLEGHPGPSPSVILQALTMSNANDGINLERLETIGDSFLKFAITAYLYCAQPTVHEGKLSHMRSKQVSNLNLYRLGRNKRLGARMIASKFEPHDNWLPPCYKAPPTLHTRFSTLGAESKAHLAHSADASLDSAGCYIPYNLITQHSIPDKSIADCVEALIGAYLLECGPRGALLFMSWLGIRVLPKYDVPCEGPPPGETMGSVDGLEDVGQIKVAREAVHRRAASSSSDDSSCEEDPVQEPEEQDPATQPEQWWWRNRRVGSLRPYMDENGRWMQTVFGELKPPPSPLLRHIDDPEGELEQMLSGYDSLERTLEYRFRDRSLLLQALTHASHHKNRLTDCYQRLEFLGDAILDYLITRHLYEDPRRHCPGALTDLRSALVNNTIFATLAARHGFHKYFRHMSPGLNEVLTKYVKIQEENGHSISEEHYLIQEDEMEQAEDVEVPKALGDLFESVAGAIFLDSGMSLGAVWKSYVKLMGKELEAFSAAAPKSPVRELLEAEPDTAKFGKPERLADGRRVRVCVEVFGRGAFKGIGRNYRIAKGTAARCALRHLRLHRR